MKQYLELLGDIYKNGSVEKHAGTGTIVKSVFGRQLRFDLKNGFPMVTTRKMYTKSIVGELLWMLSGSCDNKELNETYGVHIWDKWALTKEDVPVLDKSNGNKTEIYFQCSDPGFKEAYRDSSVNPSIQLDSTILDTMNRVIDSVNNRNNIFCFEGSLGPVYGRMWRHWGNDTVDQITTITDMLRKDPTSRRAMVTAYDPSLVPLSRTEPRLNALSGRQVLTPCHPLFQFNVDTSKSKPVLSLQLYARSQDVPVGTIYNIAFYSMLLHIMAFTLDMDVGEYIHTCGNAHIYGEQLPFIEEQLKREPLPLPTLKIVGDKINYPYEIKPEQIVIENYQYHPIINYPIIE